MFKLNENDIRSMVMESVKRILNEVCSNGGLDEHEDIVDNTSYIEEIIKQQWESSDDFWIINIDERRKDRWAQALRNGLERKGSFHKIKGTGPLNANMVGYAYVHGNTLNEALMSFRNLEIHLYQWAAEKCGQYIVKGADALKKVCDMFYARSYITINKRSFTNVAKICGTNDINSSIFIKACKEKTGTWSLIDCDIDNAEAQKELEDYLDMNNVTPIKKTPSHDGMHYIFDKEDIKNIDLSQFDIKYHEISGNKPKDAAVSLKQDGRLMVYSPCGK